jgi:uncharacterized protein YecT (DUF1311 family)
LRNRQPRQNPCDEKPISQRQLDDCAAFEYKQADAHLNKVYRKAVQYMADDLARAENRGDQKQIKYEETAIESLKEAERTWISYRDIQCKAAAQQYEGGSMAAMIYSQCLTTVTEHRTSRPQEHLRRWRPEVGLIDWRKIAIALTDCVVRPEPLSKYFARCLSLAQKVSSLLGSRKSYGRTEGDTVLNLC